MTAPAATPSRGRATPRRGVCVSARRGWGPAAIAKAPAATPSRGRGNPRRGVCVSSRRGWGPAASAKAPAATPSRGRGNPRRGVCVSSRRGWGPAASAKAPAATPSRGPGNPRRGVSVSSRRGWGPAASAEKVDREMNRGLAMKRALLAIIATALISVGLFAQVQPARPGPDVYSRMRWRYIGPEGNRTDAVAGVPGDGLTYYVGAASGGIWKTTDGGLHWEPIFDDHPVSSIGALA